LFYNDDNNLVRRTRNIARIITTTISDNNEINETEEEEKTSE